jgi:CheY-like chemotaxis protein
MKAILFVDDHKVLARVSCELLRRHGYHAVHAYSGNEALVSFGQEKFDLVVTDYAMDEMNGVELARLLRRQAPGLPIVIVSGYAAPAPCEAVNAWIEKQEMFPALLETIKRLLPESEAKAA